MNRRTELWSYLLITIVTILIWMWAAGETREEKEIICTARFAVPGPDDWSVEPPVHAFTMTVTGSRLSMQNLNLLEKNGLVIDLPPELRPQEIDIEAAVRAHADFLKTGASLISIDRGSVKVQLDRMVDLVVPVIPSLPGVQTVEARPLVEPATVTLTMPSKYSTRFGEPRVEAFIAQDTSSQLPDGILQQIDVPLRILPSDLARDDRVSLSVNQVQMSFTIRSQTRELKLDRPVPIQLSGPWQDQSDYLVRIQTDAIRDVTITADAELIRRIEAGDATVVAILHLKSIDKERHANQQSGDFVPTLYFMALQDGQMQQVKARVGDSTDPPTIDFTVTHRSDSPVGES